MKVLYIRTSTVEQNSDRQKQNNDKNCKIIEDKCSGAIPFFEREGGKKIFILTEKDIIDELIVHEIDRLGRNLIDILKYYGALMLSVLISYILSVPIFFFPSIRMIAQRGTVQFL